MQSLNSRSINSRSICQIVTRPRPDFPNRLATSTVQPIILLPRSPNDVAKIPKNKVAKLAALRVITKKHVQENLLPTAHDVFPL